jgi:hypothetical protein
VPENNGKPWTTASQQKLRDLAAGNTPTRLIAFKLGRTESAVEAQASRMHQSLKPTNQSTYGTNGHRKPK